jgi:hypothetical protein
MGGGWGHDGIALYANVYNLLTLDQNWPYGSPVVGVNHSYTHVAGWLQPK